MTGIEQLEQQGRVAKQAAAKLAILSSATKDAALHHMAKQLLCRKQEILIANEADMAEGRKKGLTNALLDRLLLTEDRIEGMANGLLELMALPDPIGEGLGACKRPNGLEIRKVRVPLGVIGIIYEARPNVTADAAGLCLKAGNAVLLRGGSEAFYSNQAVARILHDAAVAAGIPQGAIQLVGTTDRDVANRMMNMNQYIDVLIPRGGAGLIRAVVEHATVPVIETGTGICHVFVDESADLDKAADIVINAKCQRPGVCNALETLLVHEQVAQQFLPGMIARLRDQGVEVRGCPTTTKMSSNVILATEDDWATEYLNLILSIKVVQGLDEALAHIARYGTKHSESIITANYYQARRFQAEVDAAAVYVNASTRFTDGSEFGFGAEIGISTQKLHARGPMGLKELTSVKYLIDGDGQIRP